MEEFETKKYGIVHHLKKDQLKTHISIPSNRKYIKVYKLCEYCNKRFEKRFYKKHLQNIHSDKKRLCNICKKTFYSENSFNIHISTHYIKCKLCNEFVENLNEHIKIKHNSEYFECPICKKTFIGIKSLTNHWNDLHKGFIIKDWI